jgi:pimeloyl-ACP methyl ester carboxylesterase
VAALRRVGATGALNWYRAITREALRQTAPVEVPTLHIWGDRDVVFSRLATEQTVEHVSGPYHLLELEGASHWIPDEHWDDAKDVVLDHLASNRIASK